MAPKKLTLFLNIIFIFLLCLLLKSHLQPPPNTSKFHIFNKVHLLSDVSVEGCTNLHKYSDYTSKCLYVKNQHDCRSKGYINYLQIFYCNLGQFPIIGQTLLALWLVVLFYLLGDTASNYFCNSLEGLSNLLRLSPTIAGVTLLSLGNGAPDFFASIVSITGSKNAQFGLNSILGGSFFVSSAVLGIISILISPNQVSVDKASFIRDALFFLFALLILLLIISIGKISLFGAICYVCIYFLYVCAVSATHLMCGKDTKESEFQDSSNELLLESGIPLLGYASDEKEKEKPRSLAEKVSVEDKVEKGVIFSNNYLGMLLNFLELPLWLPRRVTIPIVSEEKWSKPYGVISVTLAPILLATIINTQRENVGSKSSLVTYLISILFGIVLGNLAFVTTKNCGPPRRSLFPWLAGGFAMSVTWTYIIAEELVSLLVSIGNIIGISPSILGLTVLAWGNSLGDLIANGAMAVNGGPDGAQMAVSGCFAGPMFNILMGLGFPFVMSAWAEYPDCYVIPKDTCLFETLLFLMGGVLWTLVILPKKNMMLEKSLGLGLLSVYMCFLFIRIAMAVGVLKF